MLRVFRACFKTFKCLLGILRDLRVNPAIKIRHFFFGEELSDIRFGAFRVKIQRFFEKAVRLSPIMILQRHVAALYLLVRRCVPAVLNDNGLFDALLRLAVGKELLYAADEILHEAELGHVLRHQMRKLLRQIVGVHIAICGDERFLRAVLNKREIAAPFVFDPYGVEVFRLRAENDHDLR